MRSIKRLSMITRNFLAPPLPLWIFLLLAFPLGILGATAANAETTHAPLTAIQRLHQFLQGTHTLSANFQQTLLDETGQSLEDAKGVAHLARPKRFRWEYREPYRQTIIADGDRIWFYDEGLSQVIVKPWDSFSPDTPAALLSMSQPPEEIFTIEDLGAKTSAGTETTRQWVKLTPKSPDATFVRIELGFGKETIEVMELFDSFGQTTRLVFSGLTTNTKLKPELFSFTPPEGVDVVKTN